MARQTPQERASRDHARWTSQRRDFDDVTSELVRRVYDGHLADPHAQVLELAAGTGQLAKWCPALAERSVHLDVNEAYLKILLRDNRNATAVRSDANHLGIKNDAFHLVTSLCGFDVVGDVEIASRECFRVLQPHGSFVHLLDMGTSIEPALSAAVAKAMVPIPNIFLGHEHLAAHELRDQLSPLIDHLCIPAAQFAHAVALLSRAGHPAAATLASWGMPFLPDRFEPTIAAQSFVRLTSNPQELATFCQLMRSVYLTWQNAPYAQPLRVEPSASLHLFDGRLRAGLINAGFENVASRLMLAAAVETIQEGTPNYRYDAAWVGCRVVLPSIPPVPARLHGMDVELVGADPVPGPRERLRQSVVHVCTGRKPR
ncbi:MAG: class I SAM-dependent methyltransferase [Deltaproteobacteria bacterium]|nr:class I SAM-dependent methyltransferase [Deltaproteobacteria bacterium]